MTATRHVGLGEPNGPSRSIVIAGDCVLDPGATDRPVGDDLRTRLEGATLSIANLEGAIPSGDPIAKSGPIKQTAVDTPVVLSSCGMDAVALANNHAMDYGPAGLRATREACERAGVGTVGAGRDVAGAFAPLEAAIGEHSLAVVAVCEREFGVAGETTAGTAWVAHPDAEDVVADAAESHDVVVVLAHGGIEYVPFPPPGRQRRLRRFVDAGADAVVGHHPHVPQGWEIHRGAPILYSLGNFTFAQPDRPSTAWGLVADLRLRGDAVVGVEVVPVEQVAGRAVEMHRRSPDEHLGYLDRVAELTGDRAALRARWQELAVRLFDQRYARWLRRGTAAGPLAVLRDPRAALGDGTFAPRRREDLLALLNVVRNDSHRELIQTALAVRTGEVRDRRDEAIRREVRELLAWTEDRPVYDRPSTIKTVLRALARRLPSAG